MNNIPAKHWPSAIGLTYAEGLFTAYYRYMTDDETQARLTALEARIEFQEETIRQLNDALVIQQQRFVQSYCQQTPVVKVRMFSLCVL